MEEGENEEEAIRREVLEEIGYKLEEVYNLENIFNKELGISSTIFIAKINISPGQISFNEGQEIKFFDLEEIKNLDMPKIFKDFIKRHKAQIFKNKLYTLKP